MGQESAMTPDGNVHTMPMQGPEHIESKDCWCQPELKADFTDEGGRKMYLHREIQ
jgi:hypothetical protein